MAFVTGKGTILKLNGTPVAQRVKIEGPESKVGEVDATHLDSAWKEFRPTIPEGGEVSMTVFHDPADSSHQAVLALVNDPSVEDWEIEYADGSTDEFEGFVTEHKFTGMEVEELLQAEIKIRVSGLVDRTPA